MVCISGPASPDTTSREAGKRAMVDTNLTIVAGMSGAGKSTTAKNISIAFERSGINHVWRAHVKAIDHNTGKEIAR